MKSTLAVALIAVAAFGGVKTYGAYSASTESNLLAENIEALSDETGEPQKKTYNDLHVPNYTYHLDGTKTKNGCTSSCWEQENTSKTDCHSHQLTDCCSNIEIKKI